MPILRRHAEHLGDNDDRQRVGEIVNDLEFASIAGLREHVFDDLPDARPQVLDGPRRERLADQPAQSCVTWRIGGQHRLGVAHRAILLLLLAHHLREARLGTTAVGREATVHQDRVDVVVAREHPRLHHLAPVDGGLLPKLAVHRIRVGEHSGRERIELCCYHVGLLVRS